jgi:hypothetical protein
VTGVRVGMEAEVGADAGDGGAEHIAGGEGRAGGACECGRAGLGLLGLPVGRWTGAARTWWLLDVPKSSKESGIM